MTFEICIKCVELLLSNNLIKVADGTNAGEMYLSGNADGFENDGSDRQEWVLTPV